MTPTSEDVREERPTTLTTAMLSVALGCIALVGVAGTVGVVKALISTDTLWGPWASKTTFALLVNVLMAIVGIGGLLWLKPWKGSGTPVSRATRRTNALFALSGVIGIPGALALAHATTTREQPFGIFSNSPVSPGIAIFAVASFLLAMAIAWWWYYSADEHERKAYDFGSLLGHGLFITVTPAWWIAARAGLLPQPDAMLLWCITMAVISIGWFWRRYR